MEKATITSVRFKNFKALGDFSITFRRTNVLVGPNNSGKSTLLSAFRVLATALRRAGAKSSQIVPGSRGQQQGYPISSEELPVSLENVHTNYSQADAGVTFRLSNGAELYLHFPNNGGAYLLMPGREMTATRPSDFRMRYPLGIGVVPVLGPVEHEEQLLRRDTIERGLTSHRASRHFRNFWHYNPNDFQQFQGLVEQTWPGMSIKAPEIQYGAGGSTLFMFCSEHRIDRELYWVGFGFQVWCQLLTHVLRASEASLLVVDEPEIYLHPDMQRQLLSIFRTAGPDLLLATHSSELIGEAEPGDIVLVDKTSRSGRRLTSIEGMQSALEYLGSGHNLTLTQLARTRRVLFVEGEDFKLIRRWAAIIGLKALSSGLDIVAVPVGGFGQWQKVESLGWGIHRTLGQPMLLGAIFDRDYFCEEEILMMAGKLKNQLAFVGIHERKEIENYLLIPEVLDRCIVRALRDHARRKGKAPGPIASRPLLGQITDELKDEIQGEYVAKMVDHHKRQRSTDNTATMTRKAVKIFNEKWDDLVTRLQIVPGKTVLGKLNELLQQGCGITLSAAAIISETRPSEIPPDLAALLAELEVFRTTAPPEWKPQDSMLQSNE